MKYVIWFVRFWYAAWMIPAGVEHFYHIYPQPGANSRFPLAAEMLTALLNSHLFDLVKAVELVVGVAILFGLFSPLALLISMPVAFCVFWWDAPLSEWNTSSTIAGARVLVSQVVLVVAFIAAYRPMLAARASVAGTAQAPTAKQLTLAARVLFGAWMLLNGANHFFFSFWPTPMGQTALSAELMTALVNSQLLDVCMLIELVAGALILLGYFVPAALCVVMAVSTSALFWAVLDHQPLTLGLGIVAFALNGLLMLAYLDSYKGVLQRAPRTLGESDSHTSYNTLFVQPGGRTSRGHFIAALLPLALAVLWYANKGPAVNYACWGVLCLLYPAVVLHVRRLHDLGRTGWLMLVPTVLTVLAMGIWAGRVSLGAQLDAAVPVAALLVFVAFALWGSIAKGQSEPNTFGPPLAA
jgi:uncharacterized membrane protein YhaH (DUF805 family)/uncharacterized membrane protein YphA (DoxX/SURF4 family)